MNLFRSRICCNDEPKNGEVLSMAGKQLVNEDGQTKVNDFALGTMTSSYPMGSTVKVQQYLLDIKLVRFNQGQYNWMNQLN